MTWEIRQGDALERLREMPDASVQCCITSPPYFGLRDYGHDGQIGLESTPDEYVGRLVGVFREVRRVLRDDGTLWLNLGDSYNGYPGNAGSAPGSLSDRNQHARASLPGGYGLRVPNVKQKDLLGIPWLVAFALRADGWWLRSEIVWHKPNPMPESVTDRPTRAHEQVFLLTKSAQYFYDAEAVRQPLAANTLRECSLSRPMVTSRQDPKVRSAKGADGSKVMTIDSSRGANRRSVWTVATQPYAEAHFATFPPKLIEPMVLAGSAVDDVVIDPFAGAGTTGVVSLRHQRSFIGIELSADYCDLARRRIRDDEPLFNHASEIAA